MAVFPSVHIREADQAILDSIIDGSITELVIPEGVTSIGNYAFYQCTNLVSVTLPSTLKTIGQYAFYGCSSLTSITLPSGLTSIGVNAFYGCSSLGSVDVPASCTSIGSGAFGNTPKLTTLKLRYATKFAATITDTYSAIRATATSTTIPVLGKIYVPSSVRSQYTSDTTWKAIGTSRIVSL